MTYRIYDWGSGRFSGIDPLYHGSGGSTESPFVYARQSPIRFVDSTGLFSLSNPLSFLDPIVNGVTNGIGDVNDVLTNPTVIANAYVCSFTFTIARSTCKAAGLTDTETDIVGAVQSVASAGVGGAVEGVINGSKYIATGVQLAPDVLKMMEGKLSTSDALALVSQLSLQLASEGADQFIGDYSKIIGLSAAQTLAATAAKEAAFVGLNALFSSDPSSVAPKQAASVVTGVPVGTTGNHK